jgi:UDP-glucose 4-epimerase
VRILVTGGAGYIGSITVRFLLDAGYEVAVVDTLERGHRAAVDRRAKLFVGDVGDRDVIRTALDGCSAVIHFAAYAEVAESQSHPAMYFDNNVTRPRRMLDEMTGAGVADMVFSSTCSVYGEPRDTPICEDAPRQPINAYGASKLAFETILADYSLSSGLRPVCLRYFNVVGAWPGGLLGEDHDPESHIVPRILRAATNDERCFTVFGDDYPTKDGTCVRDYVHVLDLAQAHLRALEYLAADGLPTAVNLGNGEGYSNLDVLRACEDATGVTMDVNIGPKRDGDPATLVASSARANEVLDWRPTRDLREAVADAWDWHRLHPAGYDEAAAGANP